MQRWWLKALIISVIWTVLIIGIGVIHTDVVLEGRLSPARDEEISGRYGMVCSIGWAAIWVLSFFRRGTSA